MGRWCWKCNQERLEHIWSFLCLVALLFLTGSVLGVALYLLARWLVL